MMAENDVMTPSAHSTLPAGWAIWDPAEGLETEAERAALLVAAFDEDVGDGATIQAAMTAISQSKGRPETDMAPLVNFIRLVRSLGLSLTEVSQISVSKGP
jgi:hypothetical protein